MTEAAERAFEVRHVQLGRALLAAVAAVMVTFSPDHSAGVGLAIFSGWAIATALILLIAAWLVYPQGRRGAPILLGALTLGAGAATRYTEATAAQVLDRDGYIEAVLGPAPHAGEAR